MIIQIQTIMLKVLIFLRQTDSEVSKFHLDRNNSNNFLTFKMVPLSNNGSSNSVKIALLLFLKISQMKAIVRINLNH